MKRKNYAKRKNKGLPALIIVLVCLLAAGGAAAIYFGLSNRQTLSGATGSSAAYVTDSGAKALHITQSQRYFSTDVRRPDYDAAALPDSLKAFFADEEAAFNTSLNAMLDAKTLDRDDPASLVMDFDAVFFENYATYTVGSTRYLGADNAENTRTQRRYIVDTATGNEITCAQLFKDGDGYPTLLNSKIAAVLDDGGLAGQLAALDDLYDESLTLASDGLQITFRQAVGDSITAGQSVTLDYTSLYNSLAIALPDSYKPAEPTPIDPQAEKVIALTFDDGPSGKWTEKLLDLLKQYNAKATFFVVGYNVDYHPEILQRMAAEGQEVAIHSTDHISLLKSGRSDADILEDINGMSDKIYSVCGVKPYILRPVGGSVNSRVAELLARPCIIWDVDPQDWKYRDADHVYDQVMTYAKSGDIVLSHDLYESTYEAYCRIIPELAAQGYRFVTVSELLGIDGLEDTDAYAGKIVYYRSLSRELRSAGAFDTAQAG